MANVSLISRFPRTMGHPQQDIVVYNIEQRDNYFKRYYGNCNIYMSVYPFAFVEMDGTVDSGSAIIDKVFFGFG